MKEFICIALFILLMSNVNLSPVAKTELKLYPGGCNFASLIRSHNFVDKTLFIDDFFKAFSVGDDGGTHSIFTAPRSFGKSINLDMMKRFVKLPVDRYGNELNIYKSYNYRLFTNYSIPLKITKSRDIIEQHCGKYPVIYLNFRGMIGNDIEETMNNLRFAFKQCFQNYKWLYARLSEKMEIVELTPDEFIEHEFFERVLSETLSEEGMQRSLQRLIEMVFHHFKKRVFVFVDEYDAPAMDAMVGKGHSVSSVQDLINKILGNALKGVNSAQHIAFSYLTGTVKLSSDEATARLGEANYFSSLTDDHPFHAYFGLTEYEVFKLCYKLRTPREEVRSVVRHYKGYYLPRHKMYMLCTGSIIEYTRHHDMLPYWIDSGSVPFYTKFLRDVNIRKATINLISEFPAGTRIVSISRRFTTAQLELFRDAIFDNNYKLNGTDYSHFFQYLYENGYLTQTDEPSVFKITNSEIKEYFSHQVIAYYTNLINLITITQVLEEFFDIENPDTETLSSFQNVIANEFKKAAALCIKGDLTGTEFEFHTIFYVAALQHLGMKLIKARKKVHNVIPKPDIVIQDTRGPCVLVIELKCIAGTPTYRSIFTVMDAAKDYVLPFEYEQMELKHVAICVTEQFDVTILFSRTPRH